MEETDSLLEEADGDSLLGDEELALEDTSTAFAAAGSSDASGDASVCTGDDEKDALIRKTGVLGGEDDALDTEERTGVGEECCDKTGEDEALATGDGDSIAIGSDTFGKTGADDAFDAASAGDESGPAGTDGVFVGNDDFVATDDVFAVTDADKAFDTTGTDADDVFDAAFDAVFDATATFVATDATFVATDNVATFVATFDATATATPSPFPAKVCVTGRRMTSEGSDASPPRVTRFAFPNTSEGETDRFSDLLSGANPCEATEAARGREGTSN